MGRLVRRGPFFSSPREAFVELIGGALVIGVFGASIYAPFWLLSRLLKRKYSAKAHGWRSRAAAHGHLDSMFYLAVFYSRGSSSRHSSKYSSRLDNVQAIKWLEKAAALGHIESMHYLALAYQSGDGVPIDRIKALDWLAKAAAHNHAHSMLELARMLGGYSSSDIAIDLAKANEWLTKAEALIAVDHYHRPPFLQETYLNIDHFRWIRGRLRDLSQQRPKNHKPNSFDEKKLTEHLAKLDALIGLTSVKTEIRNLVNIAILNKARAEKSLSPVALSLHLVFTGNPGTGKTTVARLVGEIYAALGLLKTGHVIESQNHDFIAEYLGQTPTKTKAVIERALDGVLFIDEAYTLTRGGSWHNPYGQEAVDTLLKHMDDNRDRLVVIAAGYPMEMRQFIASNPGLQSRFATTINFEDYNASELANIFTSFVTDHSMRLSQNARAKVARTCQQLIDTAILSSWVE